MPRGPRAFDIIISLLYSIDTNLILRGEFFKEEI